MIKLIAFVTRRPDLGREEFLRIWREDHAPLVWRLPGVRRYVQNAAIEHSARWPYDAVAEIWFDSKADVANAFASSAGADLRAHEAEFVNELAWLLTDEREVPAPSNSSPNTHIKEEDPS